MNAAATSGEPLDTVRERFRAEARQAILKSIGDKLRFSRPLGRRYGKSEDVRRRVHWDEAQVRLASLADIGRVLQWIGDDNEFRWMGGTPGGGKEEQVAGWIHEAVAALVLEAPHSDGAKHELEPLAFINLTDYGEEEVEVGRLVVNPVVRRLGIGTSLTRHMCADGAPKVRSSRAYVRCLKDNDIALGLINGLPFDERGTPRWIAREDIHECFWFNYRSVPRPSGIGREISRLREARGVSQADLAFFAGVARGTISMIESGERNPGSDLLQVLVRLLCSDQTERIKLLLSAIGETADPRLRVYQPLEKDHMVTEANLWVMSGELAEVIDGDILLTTRRALERGFDRWYFLPETREGDIAEHVRLVREGVSDVQVRRHLRFLVAPSELCALRMEIRDPRILNAEAITVEGEGDGRVPLSQGRVLAMMEAIQPAINKAARSQDPRVFDGFRRVFPERLETDD